MPHALHTCTGAAIASHTFPELPLPTASTPHPPVQATARLAHYRALGPGFEALADEHGSVLEALEEAEYELREIEQFRALGEVTG